GAPLQGRFSPPCRNAPIEALLHPVIRERPSAKSDGLSAHVTEPASLEQGPGPDARVPMEPGDCQMSRGRLHVIEQGPGNAPVLVVAMNMEHDAGAVRASRGCSGPFFSANCPWRHR